MRRVILESPFAAPDARRLALHLAYARACMRDCLLQGEAPLASHLIYTQEGVLDDDLAKERELGILAGFAWKPVAEATVVYTDLGISEGMQRGIHWSIAQNLPVEYREIPGWSYKPVTVQE